jgi:hypothetical protein
MKYVFVHSLRGMLALNPTERKAAKELLQQPSPSEIPILFIDRVLNSQSK